jgi:hypothetical protein
MEGVDNQSTSCCTGNSPSGKVSGTDQEILKFDPNFHPVLQGLEERKNAMSCLENGYEQFYLVRKM